MLKKLFGTLMTGKGPDFSVRNAKVCHIGGYELRYTLPGNVYLPGKPRDTLPSQVNLKSDYFEPFSTKKLNRTFIQVAFEWWSYKGTIVQGDLGQLGKLCLTIDVNKIEPHSTVKKGDIDSFIQYLKNDYWRYYEAEDGVNQEVRRRFAKNGMDPDDVPSQFLVQIPDEYTQEKINGATWLSYNLTGEGTAGLRKSYYWAVPLSDEYYLTVSFDMTFEQGDKDDRLHRMLNDARRIMSAVELRE
ncbi:hypothetical protein HCH_03197 [Hahella chejuensis KCTC 2396]|uniref:Tle cognate immunity protein 4 C-terminal domain-containing protein n=1 Tax=Hahella chejuensis (strain KCTC 2396) TaxID=349521 RepID=Q2SHB6_HAHCH|nr:hypothetical protein [Hahella chejuensis]ABC29958.1 hypothetical protein HCH_03197 [Hahella chejuensis KCTC 2396]